MTQFEETHDGEAHFFLSLLALQVPNCLKQRPCGPQGMGMLRAVNEGDENGAEREKCLCGISEQGGY